MLGQVYGIQLQIPRTISGLLVDGLREELFHAIGAHSLLVFDLFHLRSRLES